MRLTDTNIGNLRKFHQRFPEVEKDQLVTIQLRASTQQALPAILKLQFATGGDADE